MIKTEDYIWLLTINMQHPSPNKLTELLGKMHNKTIGIPTKATYSWLESLGYKSTNDRSLIRVLKSIGFLDDSGTPTDRWSRYRGSDHRRVLGEAIRSSYEELFSVYPNAHELDNTTLENFFGTKTTAGRQVITRQVSTFQALCERATFSGKAQQTPDAASTNALNENASADTNTPNESNNSGAASPLIQGR